MSKREKLFGWGRCVPLDREGKVRIKAKAKAMMRPTQKGKAYGEVTAKAFEVLNVLLYRFHNAKTGRCFPSYERIAELAGCARSTVSKSIKMLEDAGLLTWHHRLTRTREMIPTGSDLFGVKSVIRVFRSSNAYRFLGEASKSEKSTGTPIQVIPTIEAATGSPVELALKRFEEAFRKKAEPQLV